jgi:hypothetical protein
MKTLKQLSQLCALSIIALLPVAQARAQSEQSALSNLSELSVETASQLSELAAEGVNLTVAGVYLAGGIASVALDAGSTGVQVSLTVTKGVAEFLADHIGEAVEIVHDGAGMLLRVEGRDIAYLPDQDLLQGNARQAR